MDMNTMGSMGGLSGLTEDLQGLGINIPGEMSNAVAPVQSTNFMDALNALDSLCQWRETEVELPMLKIKALMKPIKGLEELRIKGLKASGETFVRTFNEILFNHADFQGKVKFKSLEDFMEHLGSADKAMMTYGLLFATYPELGDREFECPHCKERQVHNLRPDELIHEDSIPMKWDKKGLFTNFRDDLEIMPGFKIKIGFQTEADSIKMLSITPDNELKKNAEEYQALFDTLKLLILFIKEVTIDTAAGPLVMTDLVKEIYPFITGIKNIMVLEKLINTITNYDGLSKYQPVFYATKKCTNVNCGKDFKWMVNPEFEFFRKASSFYGL